MKACEAIKLLTENMPLLKRYLVKKFSTSALNNSSLFPSMSTKLAHIHHKPNSKPYGYHIPIPIPYHWKVKVRESLDKDISNHVVK